MGVLLATVLVAGVIGAVAILAVLALTGGDGELVLDLDVGDCFDLPDDMASATIAEVATIGCDQPHQAEVFARGELNPDRDRAYPSDTDLFAVVDRECASVSARQPQLAERFGILPVVADEASWESFRGRYVCVAVPYGGGTTTGSLRP